MGSHGYAEYNNNGDHIATHWIPTDADLMGAVKTGQLADGYGYDVRVKADSNIMLTPSFTGWSNYMMDFGAMLQDGAGHEALRQYHGGVGHACPQAAEGAGRAGAPWRSAARGIRTIATASPAPR